MADRRSAAGRYLDLAILAVTVVAVGYMLWRGPLDDGRDLIPRYLRQTLLLVGFAVGAIALIVVVPRRRRWIRRSGRAMALLLAIPLAMIALARHANLKSYAAGMGVATWPPDPLASHADRLGTLRPEERAKWAIRVAAHRLGYTDSVPDTLVLPSDWPMPDDVTMAFRRRDGVTEIWARTAERTVACLRIPARLGAASDTAAGRAACERATEAPAELAFAPVRRAPDPPVPVPSGMPGPPWRQYRGDAGKHGVAARPGQDTTGWRTMLDAQVRATPGLSGDLVLIGSHGIGHVAALDQATGQRVWDGRVPNWVHQDPVTDGRVVVFGFGSDWQSIAGREPSGVAGYDRATGRHLWTAFDESGVMTDPVVHDSVIVYATAGGVLRKRLITTGAMLDSARVPGGVIMAPPAMIGDTLIVTLEEHRVCALTISAFTPLWCTDFPGYRLMGHAAAGVGDGVVVVSGAELLRALSPREFWHQGPRRQLELLRTAFGPGYMYAAQSFIGLSLHDGRPLWTTRAFTATKVFKGHIAGTAVFGDGVAAISLPLADSLVVFEPRTGAIRWTATTHDSRGPPLLLGDEVLVAGRDGITELRDLHTGALRCRMVRETGYDRGGPTVAGGLVIFADLKGMVEAIPAAQLTACTAEGATPAPR